MQPLDEEGSVEELVCTHCRIPGGGRRFSKLKLGTCTENETIANAGGTLECKEHMDHLPPNHEAAPDGPYLDTCRGCEVQHDFLEGRTLECAHCARVNGDRPPARLHLDYCNPSNPIRNVDGHLVCKDHKHEQHAHHLPPGHFKYSCGECALHGPAHHEILSCHSCPDKQGNKHASSLDMTKCAQEAARAGHQPRVQNKNGELHCDDSHHDSFPHPTSDEYRVLQRVKRKRKLVARIEEMQKELGEIEAEEQKELKEGRKARPPNPPIPAHHQRKPHAYVHDTSHVGTPYVANVLAEKDSLRMGFKRHRPGHFDHLHPNHDANIHEVMDRLHKNRGNTAKLGYEDQNHAAHSVHTLHHQNHEVHGTPHKPFDHRKLDYYGPGPRIRDEL